MALHCQIWLFFPLLLILLNKHNLDSQREDRVCRHDHGHVTWHIGHTPDSFTGESLQSTSIFHYLHRQHTPWFRKQLRTFTCKSIKIIASILLVCSELNPGPQNVTSVGNQLKPIEMIVRCSKVLSSFSATTRQHSYVGESPTAVLYA